MFHKAAAKEVRAFKLDLTEVSVEAKLEEERRKSCSLVAHSCPA